MTRWFVAALSGCAALLGLSPVAQADHRGLPDRFWTCHADAARISVLNQPNATFSPVVANTDSDADVGNGPECHDDFEQVANVQKVDLYPTIPLSATAEAAYARTSLSNAGAARDQVALAESGAANVILELGPKTPQGNPALKIQIEGLVSRAEARCSPDTAAATFRRTYDAVTVTVTQGNGQPEEHDELGDALNQIATGLQQLAPLLELRLGERIPDAPPPGPFLAPNTEEGGDLPPDQATGLRALHVLVLQAIPQPNSPLVDLIVGQSTVDRHGDVCALEPPPPPPSPPGGDLPVGGLLVPLQDILGVVGASPCTQPRFGGEFGILGTPQDDFITGTNGSDRIFSLAGNDRVSGGRGDDCVEGAEGNDNLDGSNGEDFLLGGEGRDIMSGGSGRDQFDGGAGKDRMLGGSGVDRFSGGADRDKMSGGLGNDIISGGGGGDFVEAGQGKDTVNGGGGNDAINVAEAGPGRDSVNCGSGRDTVRANPRDSLRGCERVLTTRVRGQR